MQSFEPRRIVNLTPHEPTREMRKKGVFDLTTVKRQRFEQIIDVGDCPSDREIREASEEIARIADKTGAERALVDVPIMLVSSVERALRDRGIEPCYSQGSVRRYEADTPLDGIRTVKLGYRLEGFVEPPDPRGATS